LQLAPNRYTAARSSPGYGSGEKLRPAGVKKLGRAAAGGRALKHRTHC